MGLVNGMKLGLAINSKLKQASTIFPFMDDRELIIKSFIESVENEGRFTVVEWSVLGKQLGIFGNGKE